MQNRKFGRPGAAGCALVSTAGCGAGATSGRQVRWWPGRGGWRVGLDGGLLGSAGATSGWWSDGGCAKLQHSLPVVPGEPVFGGGADPGGVLLEGGEVVEGVGFAESASVDDGHEDVADSCAVFGFIEEGVLAVEDGHFEGSFADVVVERGAGLAQEEGEFLPVIEHVVHGFAEAAVGLDLAGVEFLFHPLFECFHDGLAVLLVMLKPLLGGHVLLFGFTVVSVNVPQVFEDAAAVFWEVIDYFDEVAAAVGIAVGFVCLVVSGAVA